MTHRFYTVIIVYCMVGMILLSCKRTPAPAPTPSSDTLVICCGGLGADQTGTLAAAIRLNTRTAVIQPSTWDAYTVDLRPIVLTHPARHLVLIGHSKGGYAVCKAATQLQVDGVAVDLMVIMDGVSAGWSVSLTIPANVRYCIVFNADTPTLGIWRATIYGPRDEITIPATTHNALPSHPDVIDRVTRLIAKL